MQAQTESKFEFRKNNFDIIRIVAALQVALAHGLKHFGLAERASWLNQAISFFPGVPIFFVVSGFLISASWERNPNYKSYFRNRLLRIYPALWVCFLVTIASIFIFFDPVVSLKTFIAWCLAQLTFVQFYNPEFLRGYGVGVVNGSLWTITVELQFYVLLPLLYLALRPLKWNKWVVTALLAGLILISQIFAHKFSNGETLLVKLAGVTVFPYLYMFFFGVILQRNFLRVKKYFVGKAHWWFLFYLALLPMIVMLGFNFTGHLVNPVSYFVLACYIISLAYSYTGKLSEVLHGNDISYGYYIYHMIIVNALIQFSSMNDWLKLIVMLLLTCVFAIASWKFVEKPCLSLKRNSIRPPESVP